MKRVSVFVVVLIIVASSCSDQDALIEDLTFSDIEGTWALESYIQNNVTIKANTGEWLIFSNGFYCFYWDANDNMILDEPDFTNTTDFGTVPFDWFHEPIFMNRSRTKLFVDSVDPFNGKPRRDVYLKNPIQYNINP